MSGWQGSRRDVALLSACWALATTGNVLLVSVSVLSGYLLAEDKAFAALPVAFQWLGTAAATAPASFLMARIGRRAGFAVGVAIGSAGAALAITALVQGSFVLLCAGVGLMGAYNGFNSYYRFAAAEVAPDTMRARAISLVLAGGVVAALLGPFLAMRSKDLLLPHAYAGAFAAYLGLGVLILVLLSLVRIPKPPAVKLTGGRPIGEIMRQPAFVVAAFGGFCAYGVMAMLMSVTPPAMTLMSGHEFDDAAFVIQWHVLAMYAPSFVTGRLIERFGAPRIMLAGGGLFLASLLTALSGVSVAHFWMALVLLGLGWSLLFVGSTTLLTGLYTTAERAKTQAVNEIIVFGGAALATLSSGALLHHSGWQAVNLAALPPILLVITATAWLARRRPTGAAA